MARYKIECCFNCQERKAECHSTCEKYMTQRKEYEATMAEEKRKGEVRRGLIQQTYDSIYRGNKRLNRKDGKHVR